jgi:hypothetical protein
MINLNNILSQILSEAPNGTINKRLKDAIINRNPVSFYYNGPKGEVLPGRRVKAELVVMGLTKKGNLVVRGWVQPPSTSKKGFDSNKLGTAEYGWRMFIISRMSGINIYEDETFDQKRPGYNENGDKSLTSIEVKSNWGTLPTPKKEIPKPTVTPTTEPEKPKTELPQPKQKEKPSVLPQPEIKRDIEVYNDLKNKIINVNNNKEITPENVKLGIDTLYKKKLDDWVKSQSEVGGNTKPGEGTRRKLEKDSEIELFRLLKNDNIKVSDTQTQTQPETDIENNETPLQESIKRMKTLIFF